MIISPITKLALGFEAWANCLTVLVSGADGCAKDRKPEHKQTTTPKYIFHIGMHVSSDTQVIHQMVVIIFEFVLIQFLSKVVFYLIVVPLKGSYDIGYFKFIDLDSDEERIGSGIPGSIQLCDLSIIGFYQFADLSK